MLMLSFRAGTAGRCGGVGSVVLLLGLVFGAACASSSTGPCGGVTCGGHGICGSVGDVAYCYCASGFHPEGLICVPNDPVNPCLRVNCSGHGSCSVEDGNPVCDCATGYEADPVSHTACLPVEPPDASGDADGDTDGDTAGARCGDGRVDSGEACDDGPLNSDTAPDACRTSCVRAHCGDAVVDSGEECDDGDTSDFDACRNSCRTARCGDGVIGPGEECDDGNTVDADGCRNDCSVPACGDGRVDLGEACDDGNWDNNDACLTSCRAASCGDGYVWSGYEDCDGDSPLACTTSCGSTGVRECSGCSWSGCSPPGEICNGYDDDCNGLTDEAGCGASSYCYAGSCVPLPHRSSPTEPYCFDLGVEHAGPTALTYTVTGRPGAAAETWNRHTSCGSAAYLGSTDTLDASGRFVFSFDTGVVTDCTFSTVGTWDSWAVVDGHESNHATTVYYISGCPGIETCTAAQGACFE